MDWPRYPYVCASDETKAGRRTDIILDDQGSSQFGILVFLLKNSGLAERMEEMEEGFTIFAPTNEAFQKVIVRYFSSANKESNNCFNVQIVPL